MKKYATITTHAALNYGAVLQAYALSRYLNDTGRTCQVLNYVPDHVRRDYSLIGVPHTPTEAIRFAYRLMHYSARKTRMKKFQAFRQEFLPLSGEELRTHQGLIQAVSDYDTVVCGSDQIWNPVLHGFDEGYFLSFPEVTCRRVSYAASFGQDHVAEDVKPEMKRRLELFEAVAFREHSAQRLMQELTGVSAPLVLDPVFLLDAAHWRAMTRPVSAKSPYLLLYMLSDPKALPYALKDYAGANGMDHLSIGFLPRDMKYRLNRDYSLGPQEFLGAVAGAELIVSNSFHCTAFAIIFEKNFYVRVNQGKATRNDRMITLLTELGLEDRLLYGDILPPDFGKPIDYQTVRQRLQERIAASKEYLERVL